MSLTRWAEQILADAKKVDAHLASKGLPEASLDNDVMQDLPSEELEQARLDLIDRAFELRKVAQGPRSSATELLWSASDYVPLQFIYRHKIFSLVPLEGSTTFAAISEAIKAPEVITRRILRQGMANFIFKEPKEGHVAHTAASRLFIEDDYFGDSVGYVEECLAPACLKLVDALDKWNYSPEPTETGFQLARNTEQTLYEYLAQRPASGERFGRTMQYWTRGDIFHLRHLLAAYNWGSIDVPGSQFIDIGGGQGGVAKAMAQGTKNLHITVQDLPTTVADGAKLLPAELKDRITFQAHDMFKEQPVKGAQAYFMRWTLHNWSDKYSIQVLKSIVPAMKPDSKIFIYESTLTDALKKDFRDKNAMALDTVMAALFNSSVRSINDWHRLVGLTDERLAVKNTYKSPGCALTLVEIGFKS